MRIKHIVPHRAANYLMDIGRTHTTQTAMGSHSSSKHTSLGILVDVKSDSSEARLAIKLTLIVFGVTKTKCHELLDVFVAPLIATHAKQTIVIIVVGYGDDPEFMEWMKESEQQNHGSNNNNNRSLCVTMWQHLCGDCCCFWFSFEPIWALFRIKYFACLTRRPCNIDNNNDSNDDDDVITSVPRVIHIKTNFFRFVCEFESMSSRILFLIHLFCLAFVPIQPPCNLCKIAGFSIADKWQAN